MACRWRRQQGQRAWAAEHGSAGPQGVCAGPGAWPISRRRGWPVGVNPRGQSPDRADQLGSEPWTWRGAPWARILLLPLQVLWEWGSHSAPQGPDPHGEMVMILLAGAVPGTVSSPGLLQRAALGVHGGEGLEAGRLG